mmetsp:Transcript_6474/g.15743  ORF Transcript_6474/g.15743 Transcript_6474/m.15743 type:complete len:210 (+) Transcript_6474:63-692(+)
MCPEQLNQLSRFVPRDNRGQVQKTPNHRRMREVNLLLHKVDHDETTIGIPVFRDLQKTSSLPKINVCWRKVLHGQISNQGIGTKVFELEFEIEGHPSNRLVSRPSRKPQPFHFLRIDILCTAHVCDQEPIIRIVAAVGVHCQSQCRKLFVISRDSISYDFVHLIHLHVDFPGIHFVYFRSESVNVVLGFLSFHEAKVVHPPCEIHYELV